MIDSSVVTSLQELLPTTSNVVVAVGENPKLDHLVSAAVIYSWLQNEGKNVELICPDAVATTIREQVSLTNEFKQKLGSQNLVVSFPYDPQSVENVSYHISDDQQTFYLTVKPSSGQEPLKADQVSFDYAGSDANLLFLVGVHDYEQLGYLYETSQSLFEDTPKVTFHSFAPEIATYAVDCSQYVALSECLVHVLGELNGDITNDMATALLTGIEAVTEQLQSSLMKPETFEAVALLMRAGGKRVYKEIATSVVSDQQQPAIELKPKTKPSKKQKKNDVRGNIEYQPTNRLPVSG